MSMEKYMGYRANGQKEKQERILPQIDIAGTLFMVDIDNYLFRQADYPRNTMPMPEIKEENGFSYFLYNTITQNLHLGDINKPENFPEFVRIILLPPLIEIDPVGLARRHGLWDDFYTKMNTRVKQTMSIGIERIDQHQTKKQRHLKP